MPTQKGPPHCDIAPLHGPPALFTWWSRNNYILEQIQNKAQILELCFLNCFNDSREGVCGTFKWWQKHFPIWKISPQPRTFKWTPPYVATTNVIFSTKMMLKTINSKQKLFCGVMNTLKLDGQLPTFGNGSIQGTLESSLCLGRLFHCHRKLPLT